MASSTLCKIARKLVRDDIEALAALAGQPRIACGNCGRTANERDSVCKPRDLPAAEAPKSDRRKKKKKKKKKDAKTKKAK